MEDLRDNQGTRSSLGPAVWGVKLLVSAGLLLWILLRTNLDEAFGAMRGADLKLVVGAFALNVVGWGITVSRWRVLLRAQGIDVPRRQLLQSYLSASFFNNLLPSTVGGDGLRAYDSWRWGAGKVSAIAVVGVDRLMGMLALLAFAMVALPFAPQALSEEPWLPLSLGLGAMVIFGMSALALLPLARFRRRIDPLFERLPGFALRPFQKFSQAFQVFRDDLSPIRAAFLLSLALQINVIVHYFLISQALSLSVGFSTFFLIIPLALAVMAIPLSVNAIGIRENVLAFFLGFYGVATSSAVAFAWISFALILLQGLIGGVVYALRRSPGDRNALTPTGV